MERPAVSVTELRARAGEYAMLAALGQPIKIIVNGVIAAVLGPLPPDEQRIPAEQAPTGPPQKVSA